MKTKSFADIPKSISTDKTHFLTPAGFWSRMYENTQSINFYEIVDICFNTIKKK